MKILYLTNESYLLDPIIQSQVIPLISTVTKKYSDISHIDLLTFEPRDRSKVVPPHGSHKVTSIVIVRRHHFINMIVTLFFLLRHGWKYDIIHVRSYPPMIAALMVKSLFRFRVIFDPRGLYADEFLYYGRKKMVAYTFKYIERFFYRLSDAVVTVSDKFKKYVQERYQVNPDSVIAIPTFASVPNQEMFDALGPNIRLSRDWHSNIILCYSGSFEGWQLIDQVVDFFAVAAQHSPDFRYVFITKQKEEFEIYLDGRLPKDSYGIWSATTVQLPVLLSQCDYGVLFRHEHIINKVAAPIKVKDYLLAGLKVILSDNIGDSSDFVRRNDCGHVIEVLNKKYMRGIVAQLKKPSEPEKQAIIRNSASVFSIDVAANAYHSLYESLCPSSAEVASKNYQDCPISVCMATFNGEKYVVEQLKSILAELAPYDEVIVVDDFSTDSTTRLIECLGDARVKIFINYSNIGHVRSFARAIELCANEIIFMSDQDDRWKPGRVELMRRAISNSNSSLVTSNSTFISHDGQSISYKIRGVHSSESRSHTRNILGIFAGETSYYGCAMAFRKTLKSLILPIPAFVESHDIWIAMAANVSHSNVHLDDPTFERRIHSSNASTGRRPLFQRLAARLIFFASMIILIKRVALRR